MITTDIGRLITDITPRFRDPTLYDDIDRVLDSLHGVSREIKNDDGNWYYRRIVPYRTQDNRILGVVLVFDDITIQKQSVLSLLKIYELPAMLLMVVDKNSKIVNLSSGWESLLGYSKEELEGKLITQLIHPDDQASTMKEAKKVQARKNQVGYENRYLCKDGTYKILYWSSSLDKDTGYRYGSAQDSSKLKKEK